MALWQLCLPYSVVKLWDMRRYYTNHKCAPPPCWHSFVPMDRGGVSTGSTFSWPIPIKAVSMPVPLTACKMFCSTVSRMPNVFRMYLSCPIESGSLLEMTITHFIFRCLGAHAQARYTFVCLCVLFVDL